MEDGKNIVSIAKFDGTIYPLKEAITLCKGFENLKKEDHVIIKPNIAWGGGLLKSVKKYAFVTTKRMIEDIIILLKEHGCNNISIGEGTVVDEGLKSSTKAGFKWIKYTKLKKKYDVNLIDFNSGTYRTVELGGIKVEIAEFALTCDFLIDVPVLKTHSQAVVSLGIKNLKGCISIKSRREFHKKALHKLIAELGNYLKPDLTVIDGIYGLENGPSASGTAHRTNVIIAGKDVFSCDVVGSHVLGIDPNSVPSLQEYTKITKQSMDVNDIEIKGKTIDEVRKKMEWRVDYLEFFTRNNLKGVTIQEPGSRVCTGCFTSYLSSIVLFVSDNPDLELDNLEICVGSDLKAREDSKTVLLLGNCAIAANKDLKSAIKIEGCPPSTLKFLKLLYKHAKKGVYRKRVLKMIATGLGIYDEDVLNRGYAYPDFDKKHFK